MNRSQLIQDKSTTTAKFVNVMTAIINAVHGKSKRDNDFNTVRDGFMAVKNIDPECVIMVAGPYVWKYREFIMSGNLKPLLEKDFKSEIDDEQDGIKKSGLSLDQIYILVEKIKKIWTDFTLAEQGVLKLKFQELVKQYATFVAICKKLTQS